MDYDNVAYRLTRAIVREVYPTNEEIIDNLYDMFDLRKNFFVADDGIYYWGDGDYCGHFEKHLITEDKDKVEILKAIELLKRKYEERKKQ